MKLWFGQESRKLFKITTFNYWKSGETTTKGSKSYLFFFSMVQRK